MAGEFNKPDGLGVVDDHDVLARQIAGIEKSLRAAHGKLKDGAESKELNDALSSIVTLNSDIKMTRGRLVDVEQFILGLSRFVDMGRLKRVIENKVKEKDQ